MDSKPKNKPLKEFLIEGIAQRMKLPEHVVNAVVMHQFKGITKALQTYKSVEMTGFGKWVFQERKARQFLDGLEKEQQSRKTTEASDKYGFLNNEELEDTIEKLKIHLAQNQTYNADRQNKRNSGRLEEHGGKKPRGGRGGKSQAVDMRDVPQTF